MTRPLVGLTLLALAACGGGATKPAVAGVEGNVIAGTQFQPVSANFTTANNHLYLYLTDRADICTRLQSSNAQLASTKALIFDTFNATGFAQAAPFSPGTFSAYTGLPKLTGRQVSALYQSNDSACNASTKVFADGGTVEVTSYTEGQSVSGNFTLSVAGATVRGFFTASYCGFDVTRGMSTACEL